MIRFLLFIIIIGGSIAAFLLYINPHYKNVRQLRQEALSYTAALENAKKLREARDELQARYNAIPGDQIEAVETILPDNVDNIRLIIQLNSIALKTGMSSLREVDYSTDTPASASSARATNDRLAGDFQIKFSTTGSYKNFLNFLSTLEANLRLVDVNKISFDVVEDPTKGTFDYNKYTVTLKTYWLKN
ncbi:MAG TPA: hypothetical protein VLB02_01070 [Candidatus Paceibacterota bacterium]|nr:hypothetical protein [Candidatus Paceibacterota bacterium]